jgi:hypothetical protein
VGASAPISGGYMPTYTKGDLTKNLSTMAFHDKLLKEGWEVKEEKKPEVKVKKAKKAKEE